MVFLIVQGMQSLYWTFSFLTYNKRMPMAKYVRWVYLCTAYNGISFYKSAVIIENSYGIFPDTLSEDGLPKFDKCPVVLEKTNIVP